MAVRYWQSLRSLSPAVYFYFLATSLIGFTIDGGIYSVLFNLYLVRLGFGPELIGIVNAAGMFSFALASLPAGALGERWGSQRLLIAGLALMMVGGVLIALTDMLSPDWLLAWLIGNITLLYLGLALAIVNGPPFLMSMLNPEQRSSIFSTQVALSLLSAFAGSMVGGFLPQIFAASLGLSLNSPQSYRYALLVAGLGMLPAILAAAMARPGEAQRRVVELPAQLDQPNKPVVSMQSLLMRMALVRLFQVAGLAATTIFFNVYMDAILAVPTAEIGLMTAVGRLLATPMALATPLLVTMLGKRPTVFWSSIGTALFILPLALIPHWGAAGIGFIGVVSLSSIRYASSLVYFLELAPPDKRATVSGMTEMAAGISFTAMTFGGGYIAALLGYHTLFLIGAALTFVGSVIFWVMFPKRLERE